MVYNIFMNHSLLKKDVPIIGVFGAFLILFLWWLYLLIIKQTSGESANLVWAASYQILALWGGIGGIIISHTWGGIRSIFGRAVLAFAIGLLCQVFGQSFFSFYNIILQVEIPYPSLADIGFFGSVIFYIYGIWLLAKSAGVKFSLRSTVNIIWVILIPLIMLLLSYYFFLKDYVMDEFSVIKIILDVGYPFGQAIYVAIAILTYVVCRSILGGIMRNKVLFILFALCVQYLADYNFLYQASHLTWINGGYGDLLYMLAYFLMTVGLLRLQKKFLSK